MSRTIFINRYYSPDHSATAQLLTDLSEYLVEHESEVHVITSRLSYEGTQILSPAETINGVSVKRIWTTSFGRGSLFGRAIDYLSFYFSVLVQLLLFVRRGDVVVAKTDPPMISIVVAFVCLVKRARLINWLQDLFPEVAEAANISLFKGPIGYLVKRARNWSLKRARVNVVLGTAMKDLVLKQGVAIDRIVVIPNWTADSNLVPVDKGHNEFVKDWSLGDKFVVGYSGNLGIAHDYQEILNAATELKDESDIMFLMIGSGAGMAALKGEVAKRKLLNVTFKPYQQIDQLSKSLSASDVHIVSLKPEMEGLIIPSKLYGVLAVGRPILNLGKRGGEVDRVVTELKLGRTLSPDSDLSLASAIVDIKNTLENDAATSQNHCQHIRDYYRKHFDYGISLSRWRSVIEKVKANDVSQDLEPEPSGL